MVRPTVRVPPDREPLFELFGMGKAGPPGRLRFSPAEIQQIARTVRRTPEVMVKVTGGGSTVGAVAAHLSYISRHGKLEIESDYGDPVMGRDEQKELLKEWHLDLTAGHYRPQRAGREASQTVKLVKNIVLSMPAPTPPEKVLAAAKKFAREKFALQHRYALVLHTDQKHPHVHIVVKAESKGGPRLHIDKAMLRAWREDFAKMMREQGAAANATPSIYRGRNKSRKKDAVSPIRREGGAVPIAEAVLASIGGRASWKEPVWLMLCDDSRSGGSSEADGVFGPTLLEYGLNYPQHRNGIGRAALECLQDPRMERNRWIDAYQWIAVLAHEFADASPQLLHAALLKREPIYCAAAAALIARLGEVPDGVKFERVKRTRRRQTASSDFPQVSLAATFQLLTEFSRDSETLHPKTVETIERSLLLTQLDEPSLRDLAAKGHPGILIAAVMRHCYGVPPLLSESLPLFDVWGILWGKPQRSQDEERLLRTWNAARLWALQEPGAGTAAYLDEIDRKLAARGIWQIPLTSEILRIRGSLLDSQIETVLLEYARHATFLHRKVFGQLVVWLSGDLNDSTKKAVVDASRAAIVLLNETPWTPDRGTLANVWAFYLFPILYWSLSGKPSVEADAVFLRALQSMLEKGDERAPHAQQIDNVATVLGVGEPLFKRVPASRIRAVVLSGLDAPSPVLRTLCRMIQSVAETA